MATKPSWEPGWELCAWVNMTGSAGGAGSCVRGKRKKRRRPEEGSRGGEGGDIGGLDRGWVKETLNKETLLKSELFKLN